jgi:DNA segregation ATPase FtsK/SpoIIIE-like protein
MTVTCSASLNPSASDMPDLAKIVQDEELVEIEADPDLFDSVAPIRAAAKRFDDMSREDGTTVTLSTGDGKTIATFGDGPDPLYDQAVQIVRENQKVSISLVQRYLKIGYNRAARLVEDMKKAGLAGPTNATGQCEFLGGNQ